MQEIDPDPFGMDDSHHPATKRDLKNLGQDIREASLSRLHLQDLATKYDLIDISAESARTILRNLKTLDNNTQNRAFGIFWKGLILINTLMLFLILAKLTK